MPLYAGLEKYSCDMCGSMGEKPQKTVRHKDGSKADICGKCYSKCLVFPKFQQGLKDGDITVSDYTFG